MTVGQGILLVSWPRIEKAVFLSSCPLTAEVSCLSPGLESVEVSHLCLSTFTELPRMLSVSSGWSECSTREVSSLKKLVSSG